MIGFTPNIEETRDVIISPPRQYLSIKHPIHEIDADDVTRKILFFVFILMKIPIRNDAMLNAHQGVILINKVKNIIVYSIRKITYLLARMLFYAP